MQSPTFAAESKSVKDMFAFYWMFGSASDANSAFLSPKCMYDSPAELLFMIQQLQNSMLLPKQAGPDIWGAYETNRGTKAMRYTELEALRTKILSRIAA